MIPEKQAVRVTNVVNVYSLCVNKKRLSSGQAATIWPDDETYWYNCRWWMKYINSREFQLTSKDGTLMLGTTKLRFPHKYGYMLFGTKKTNLNDKSAIFTYDADKKLLKSRSGRCLDVYNYRTNVTGAETFLQNPCHGRNNQQFNLYKY